MGTRTGLIIISMALAGACGPVEAPELVEVEDVAETAAAVQAGPGRCVLRAPARAVRVERGRTRTVVVSGVPDPSTIRRAWLRVSAFDLDRKKEAIVGLPLGGDLRLRGRPALADSWRRLRLDVSGRLVAGDNAIRFAPGTRRAAYRVRKVALIIEGPALSCAAPASLVANRTPAGLGAFAALAPSFPTAKLMKILGGLERPFTSVLLDFGPAFDPDGVQMYRRDGRPNPAHFAALDRFIGAYVAGTPHAQARHLQLYLINGPGMRRGGSYGRAFHHGLAAFDRAVQGDRQVRDKLARYLTTLSGRLQQWHADVQIRLVVSLEDNLTAGGARAIRAIARQSGLQLPIGRNPCACGYGDLDRVGDFHEIHVHGSSAVQSVDRRLRRGDVFSNDGWGWTVPHRGHEVSDADVVAMARESRSSGAWLNLWYDPLQGYPIPSRGRRDFRCDHRPKRLLDLIGRAW